MHVWCCFSRADSLRPNGPLAHQAASVHGINKAKILEWVAMPSSRGSSRPRDRIHISYVSCIGREILYH